VVSDEKWENIRGGNTLILTIPGQPDYELVPVRNNEFNFKNLTGFSVKFNEVSEKILYSAERSIYGEKEIGFMSISY
jgi:hypothetical protein